MPKRKKEEEEAMKEGENFQGARRFKKGSKAAKAFMASIRGKRGKKKGKFDGREEVTRKKKKKKGRKIKLGDEFGNAAGVYEKIEGKKKSKKGGKKKKKGKKEIEWGEY